MSASFFDISSDLNGNVNDVIAPYLSTNQRINGIYSNGKTSQETVPTVTVSSLNFVNNNNNHNQNHSKYEKQFKMMNQKFSQMSLSNSGAASGNIATTRDCDLNGNDYLSFNPTLSLPTANSNSNDKNAFFEIDNTNDNNHLAIQQANSSHNFNNNNNNGNHWNIEHIINNLRKKLNTIQQIQNEFPANYRDAQNNYNTFVNNWRNQLNTFLQEISMEIDQTFKLRLNELDHQKNQIEDALKQLQSKKDSQNVNTFLNNDDMFDSELVKNINNILEYPNLSIVDFRIPLLDPVIIERALRSLLIILIKSPSNTEAAINALTSMFAMNIVSNDNDLPYDNNNMAIANNFTMFNQVPFPIWQPPTNQAKTILPQNNYYNFTGNDEIASASTGMVFNHSMNGHSVNDLNPKQAIPKLLQPKIKRERISYYFKFGEQGTFDGQFAEPSGIAVNITNDEIYIADANNHRVQVFDKTGKFKFHFGDGKMKFPNRVALSKLTGEIVVSERPPVHQIQVYGKNGTFVCKFGAKHLKHPRGLAVDHMNRVIVVECKVMRVFIFNLQGVLLNSFDCSEQIQFPNAVAVSKKDEIFISDNRNHCVKVFNFFGEFLRQIGGQGITNYPIGVCLNEAADQLLVVDNYNNLNVTLFRLDGQLIGAYESSAKHQQCLDVALFGDNSIVVTSKDLQVYFYRLNCINNNNQSSKNINDNQNTHYNLPQTRRTYNNNNHLQHQQQQQLHYHHSQQQSTHNRNYNNGSSTRMHLPASNHLYHNH